ncbi:hypothetical protein ACIGW8_02650 [Streptomyces sioyaensis]|uniref:hypothetical protein n=1 Tax=Streptomyces sioyaensis TaxID=67364 RepID=UPI0037D0D3B9
MFRPLRMCADVPSLRALRPLSQVARTRLSALPVAPSFFAGTLPRAKPPEVSEGSKVSEGSEVSAADAGARG